MKSRTISIVLLALLLFGSWGSFAQKEDTFSYIEKYNIRMDSIKNYVARFTIKSDIKSMSLPEVHGKVFFKWPVHYSVAIRGFAVLPKGELVPVGRLLHREDYKAIDMGEESVDRHLCHVIELRPVDTASEVDHFVVWVDEKSYLVRRVLRFEKNESEFKYHYTYDKENDLLPAKLIYSFEYLDSNPLSILYNPIWISNKPREARLVKGKLILDFQYYDVRREGDQ